MTTNEPEGKIYSNGLPMNTVKRLEDIVIIAKEVIALLRRILTFPMVTVAAMNGMKHFSLLL